MVGVRWEDVDLQRGPFPGARRYRDDAGIRQVQRSGVAPAADRVVTADPRSGAIRRTPLAAASHGLSPVPSMHGRHVSRALSGASCPFWCSLTRKATGNGRDITSSLSRQQTSALLPFPLNRPFFTRPSPHRASKHSGHRTDETSSHDTRRSACPGKTPPVRSARARCAAGGPG